MKKENKIFIVVIAVFCIGALIYFISMALEKSGFEAPRQDSQTFKEAKKEEIAAPLNEILQENIITGPDQIARDLTVYMGVIPHGGSWNVGDKFIIDIVMSTDNNFIDGVDIRYLSYDPQILEVQDSDKDTPGVQIEAGSLMPLTVANSVDVEKGTIIFSQIVSGGSRFKNVSGQTLARVRFIAKKSGKSDLRFDFTPQATRDANITSAGKDILSGVINGQYFIGD